MNPSERPRVIVALDFANPMRALGLAERLDPHDCGLKVGKELFVTAGPDPVRWMVAHGYSDEEIRKAVSGNIVRVLEQVWNVSRSVAAHVL